MIRIIAIIMCCCLLGCSCSNAQHSSTAPNTIAVLIDPGHGGFDGGAVAADGTNEKHINLAISLYLQDFLSICGMQVRMTRNTDCALNAEDSAAVRSNKSSDMQARLALYQQAEVVLSIHQNLFSVPKYSGTQVFYSANHPQSQLLADCIRSAVLQQLQPENQRELKRATNGIYLLHHTTTPCALIECGFLSNPTERDLLKTPDYQQKMAFAICCGYWNFQIKK